MTKKRPSVDRLAELQQFITDYAGVERLIDLGNTARPENDVEHSFGLALTAWFIASHIAPELNLEKILKYAMVHDMVEIYAGDTFAHAPSEHLQTKSQLEKEAAKRIAKQWPDFPAMNECIEQYEKRQDEEAKFVYAVDKMLPVLMASLGEKAGAWIRQKITLEMEMRQKAKILESAIAAPYYEDLIEWFKANGFFYDPATHRGA